LTSILSNIIDLTIYYLQQSCPCDVYPGTEYQHAYYNLPYSNDWTPKLSRAPRESVFGSQAFEFGPDTGRKIGLEPKVR